MEIHVARAAGYGRAQPVERRGGGRARTHRAHERREKTGESKEYMRTLLLPEMKSLHRPATLITPNLTFRSGYRIIIRLGNEEVKAQLTTESLSTQSFSQFEFALLQSQETMQAAVTASPGGASRTGSESAGKDDFDSLWTNL